MIRCLLIQITRNQRGQAIRKERMVSGDDIHIGRAAECKIHLLDHRVNMHHAVIRHAESGKIEIEGVGAALNINGVFEQRASLWPGSRILIGPYALTVETIPEREELTVSYELINPLPDTSVPHGEKLPTTLAETGLSIRLPTLLLAATIAILFLILPIVYSLNPALQKALAQFPVTLDEAWNVGQMSPGHRAISMKCNVCHLQPFKAVPDHACANCHKSVANHIADQKLHARVFKEVRCAECHLDHRGKAGLVRRDTSQCVACHGNIKTRRKESTLPNIHDFSQNHPAFQLTLRTGPEANDIRRVRQSDTANLVEKSGLKFSHQVHFEKALIELPPSGDVREIQCDDCHKPDDAGQRFKPMVMTVTCQQSKCHALNLTPVVEGRQVPHASALTVMTALREYYASRAISKVYVDGVTIADLRRARNWAYAQANSNAQILFQQAAEGTCLECHEITPDPENKEVPWQVTPVHVADHWLPKSKFPHTKHQTSNCVNCHDVEQSDNSSDVSIPTIEKCRECHVGSKQAKTLISSACNTCHNFHGVGGSKPGI